MFNLKKVLFVLALGAVAFGASAQENSAGKVKIYGFIRNYATFDTREGLSGTEDFFYYLPNDEKIVDGTDLNAVNSFRFAALTSRLGVDVTGYRFGGWSFGAKIEADFYNGLSGSTGTANFRLRQAFFTASKDKLYFKFGQAWHPLAADMPDVLSLNTGAPFNPFSRTPLLQFNYTLSDVLTLNAYAIWQMQYTSAGPDGASANYIEYGCTPELYLGLSYEQDGAVVRAGVDMLSIKPRRYNEAGTAKVSDRITTFSPFLYASYKEGLFSVKAKTVLAQAGEHLNLNGGYAVSAVNTDGSWSYTPTRNSSSWVSLMYGDKWQGIFFAGYVKNFGTAEEIIDPIGHLYFSKNSHSNMNQMFRLSPTVVYNFGKLSIGLEYEMTGVQYGDWEVSLSDSSDYFHGLATGNLRWVANHRIQTIVKFSF